jgi:hypothetical protein
MAKTKRAEDAVQVVEHLPSMYEALGSIPTTTEKKKMDFNSTLQPLTSLN